MVPYFTYCSQSAHYKTHIAFKNLARIVKFIAKRKFSFKLSQQVCNYVNKAAGGRKEQQSTGSPQLYGYQNMHYYYLIYMSSRDNKALKFGAGTKTIIPDCKRYGRNIIFVIYTTYPVNIF